MAALYDGALALDTADGSLCGPTAALALGARLPPAAEDTPAMARSLAALRLAALAPRQEFYPLMASLYFSGRRPCGPAWLRRLPDAAAVGRHLRIGRLAAQPEVARWFGPPRLAGEWWFWRAPREGTSEKLYIALAPAALAEQLPMIAAARAEAGASAFKLPASARGLQRPDRCVAYFPDSLARRQAEATLAPLLAGARHWSECALALSDRPDAYLSPAEDITRATVGPGGLAHGPAGAALVHGLVAGATGDPEGVREAMALFVTAAEEGGEEGDLFLGTAGHLLGTTLLLDACGGIEGGPDPAPLEELGSRLAERLGRLLVEEPPIGAGGQITRLGMAHGWAGLLYTLLGWARWKGQPPPKGTEDRLAQLRAAALPTSAGLRWPILAGGDASRPEAHMPGWCNGGAGHALLWVLAAEMLGKEHLAVAEAAAEEATAACSEAAVPFLCCGTVGVGFARLALFLATGEVRHRDAATLLAERAAVRIRSGGLPAHSLFRGAVGHAVLVAALQRPEAAVLPVFGLPVGR